MKLQADAATHPEGHPALAALAIVALSMLLVAGLALAGWIDRIDGRVGEWVSRGGRQVYAKELPAWLPWLAGAVLAAGLAGAILATPGGWRRVVLWLVTLVIVAAWAPVLSLAAHQPAITVPWIACLWAGFCAMVHASRHRMPCDAPSHDDSP